MPNTYDAIAENQNTQFSKDLSKINPELMFRDTDATDEEVEAFKNSRTALSRGLGITPEQAHGILRSDQYIPERYVGGMNPQGTQMLHQGNFESRGGYRNWNIPSEQINNPDRLTPEYFNQVQQLLNKGPANTVNRTFHKQFQQAVPGVENIRKAEFNGVPNDIKALNTVVDTAQGVMGSGTYADYNPVNYAFGKAMQGGHALTSATTNALGLGDNGWKPTVDAATGAGIGVTAANKLQSLLTTKLPRMGTVPAAVGRVFGGLEQAAGITDAYKAMTTKGRIPTEQPYLDRANKTADQYAGNTLSAFGSRLSNNTLYNAGQVGADAASIMTMKRPTSLIPYFANGSIARNIGHGSREWATLQHTDSRQYAPDDRRSYRNVGQNMWQLLGAGDKYRDTEKTYNRDLAWNATGGNVGDMDARAQNMLNASKMNQPINIKAVQQASAEFANNPAYKNLPKPAWLAKRNEYLNQRNVWSKPFEVKK